MAEDYFGIVGTTQAGAYRVEAVVAEGGFGVVYRAFHDAFQAPVALKCLKIPMQMSAEHQAEFLVKFREEAALLFRLSASIPSVVRPLHVDRLITPDGRFVPFMALEWLEGEGLDQLIQRRAEQGLPPVSLKRVVRLLAPVARALARAHHFPGPDGPISIVHRDLKPDNIFLAKVNGEEVVKIFDFGIAKARSVASQVAGRLSQGGSMTAFTPGYGAPEQWLPKRYGQTGPWTDVFGLALTVLEVATGRAIIDGDTAAMMGTACDERRRPTPRNEGLDVSDEVEAVFMAALAVDPRKRYPDAGAFWDALESALGLEVSATPTLSGVQRPRDTRTEGSGPPPPREERVSVRPPPGMRVDKSAPTMDAEAVREAARPASPAPPPPPPKPALPPPPVLPSIPDIELSAAPPPKPLSRRGSGEHAAVAPPPKVSSPPPAPIKEMPSEPPSGEEDDIEIALDVRANARAKESPRPEASAATSSPGSPSTSGSFSRPQTAGAAAAAAKTSGVHDAPVPARIAPPSPLARIRTPLWIGVAGIFLVLVEQIHVSVTGSLLSLGPVRLTWIAGCLITFGVVMVMKRLIFTDG